MRRGGWEVVGYRREGGWAGLSWVGGGWVVGGERNGLAKGDRRSGWWKGGGLGR